VPNVLNHLSLSTATGFTVKCDVDDIRPLCWLWEWDGEILSFQTPKDKTAIDDDDNPFLVPEASSDWTRGAMRLLITPTTQFIRAEGKRMSAYGIGIKVEMDLADGKGGGMAAVARWTAEGESRRRQLEAKLRAWVKVCHVDRWGGPVCSILYVAYQLHAAKSIPTLPLADLPTLASTSKPSSLTKLLAK
jgi:hypothetical protein